MGQETIFMETQVFDKRLDYYRTLWACPQCGELMLMNSEPITCTFCKLHRPGKSSKDYHTLRKRMHDIATKRLADKFVEPNRMSKEEGPSDEAYKQDAVMALRKLGVKPVAAKRLVDIIIEENGSLTVDRIVLLALRKRAKGG